MGLKGELLFFLSSVILFCDCYGPLASTPIFSTTSFDNAGNSYNFIEDGHSFSSDFGLSALSDSTPQGSYWWLNKKSPFVALPQQSTVYEIPSTNVLPISNEITEIKYESNPFLNAFLKDSTLYGGAFSSVTKVSCTELGYICAPVNLCRDGLISKQQAESLALGSNRFCNAEKEVCCRIASDPCINGCLNKKPLFGETIAVTKSYPQPTYAASTGYIKSEYAHVPSHAIASSTYNGPLNTTPHPGCAAALKCVPDNYCTVEGVMSDIPVQLTREFLQSRVPLSECVDPSTGLLGKCCRDPNYKDPWPNHVDYQEHGHAHDHTYHHTQEHVYVHKETPTHYYTTPKPELSYVHQEPSYSVSQAHSYESPTQVYLPPKPTTQPPEIYLPPQPTTPPQIYLPPKPTTPPQVYLPPQPTTPPPQIYHHHHHTKPTTPPQIYIPPKPTTPPPQIYLPPKPTTPPPQIYLPPKPTLPPQVYLPPKPTLSPQVYLPPPPTQQYLPPKPVVPVQPPPTDAYLPPVETSYVPPSPNPSTLYIPPSVQVKQSVISINPYEPPPNESPPQIAVTEKQDYKSECGVKVGDGTEFGETPWYALVYSIKIKDLSCGGVIVSENAVLSSATCLEPADASTLVVKIGPTARIYKVATISRHPEYDSITHNRDLALVILKEPIQFDPYVQKICLPPIQSQTQSAYKDCSVSTVSNYFYPGVLQKYKVQALQFKDCESRLKTTYLGKHFILKDTFTCGVTPQDAELCQVKAGEPLTCNRGDGVFELYGIKSWDLGCQDYKKAVVFSNNDNVWLESTLVAPLQKLVALEESLNRSKLKGESLEGVNIDEKPGFGLGYGK